MYFISNNLENDILIHIHNVISIYSTELDSSGSWLVKSPDLGKTWNVLQQTEDGLLDIAASSLGNDTVKCNLYIFSIKMNIYD